MGLIEVIRGVFGNVFPSSRERDREAEKKRRKAFRNAENALDDVKMKAEKIKKDRDKAWQEARQYLKDGQKAASQRSLQTVRASELLMNKLEQKRWVFQQLLTKLDMAQTDQEFAKALGNVNTVVQIDPEAVADVLDEVQDKLGEQVDTDRIWERAHEKEMQGMDRTSDMVPSIEEMEKQLVDEVAADIGERSGTRATEGDMKDRIGEGRDRLRNLMDGDK
jgi:hypothetical protein